MEDLEAGTKNLYKSIAASGRPAGELADEYKRLADELAGIEDPARRSARAVELLGRNGLALLPMLSKGGEDLQRRLDRAARRSGACRPRKRSRRRRRSARRSLDVWQSLKRIPGAVPSALLPFADAIEAAADKAVDLLAAVKAFIRANALVIIGVTAAAAALVALGGAVVVRRERHHGGRRRSGACSRGRRLPSPSPPSASCWASSWGWPRRWWLSGRHDRNAEGKAAPSGRRSSPGGSGGNSPSVVFGDCGACSRRGAFSMR
jgi:hypothetical protein